MGIERKGVEIQLTQGFIQNFESIIDNTVCGVHYPWRGGGGHASPDVFLKVL